MRLNFDFFYTFILFLYTFLYLSFKIKIINKKVEVNLVSRRRVRTRNIKIEFKLSLATIIKKLKELTLKTKLTLKRIKSERRIKELILRKIRKETHRRMRRTLALGHTFYNSLTLKYFLDPKNKKYLPFFKRFTFLFYRLTKNWVTYVYEDIIGIMMVWTLIELLIYCLENLLIAYELLVLFKSIHDGFPQVNYDLLWTDAENLTEYVTDFFEEHLPLSPELVAWISYTVIEHFSSPFSKFRRKFYSHQCLFNTSLKTLMLLEIFTYDEVPVLNEELIGHE